MSVPIELREGMGSDIYLHFSVDAPPVLTEDTRELASDIGEKAVEELHEQATERRSTHIARVSPESRASVGKSCELHVDLRKLYFFDPATGRSIGDDREAVPVPAAGALAD
jgi:multiple sugar transport system ATP-binding protein